VRACGESREAYYVAIFGEPSALDNTPHGANHVHEVWRDFKGDFGRDHLAEHYGKSHR
jgi:hypothetical protein